MTSAEFIEDALGMFAKATSEGSLWTVTTQCLYPSNDAVTVFISGGPEGCVVSDNGGVMDVLSDRGIVLKDPDKILWPFCKPRGLKADQGAIVSPVIAADALPDAIVMVANAASAAAAWGVEKLRPHQRRDVRKALYGILLLRYARDSIGSHVSIPGASTRRYAFDHVVSLNGKKLVVDAVVPEASAINAKAIANLDLARQKDPTYVQRIVYDEEDTWRSSDLTLMQTAAPLIQLGSFGRALDEMRAAA